jgi:hypothetical protein
MRMRTMPADAAVPAATTPADNGYCPQSASFDGAYSGDLDDCGDCPDDYAERDARVDATRAEFARDRPWKGPGVD